MKVLTKYLIIFIGALALATEGYSQQQAMFTQYMFNAVAINPGVVGTHGSLSMTALAREQWSGLEGAPSTQTFSIHSPLLNERVGLGLQVLRDQIGVTKQHAVFGSYAYRVKFRNATLSMGISAGFNSYNTDPSSLRTVNPDAHIQDDYAAGFKPNFGTGAYFYTNRLYLGLSAPMLVNHDVTWDTQNTDRPQQRQHYFLMGGYVFDLGMALKLKPNFLIKYVQGAPISADINVNLLIHDVLWIGVSHRSFDSIDGLIEFQISNALKVGYAHDFTLSDLQEVNNGTHEIMINYRVSFKAKKAITPRYF